MCHQLPPASLAPLRRITRSPRPSCERPVPGSHRRFMLHIANGADWHQQPGIAGARAHLPGAPTWAHLPLTARKLPLALHRPGSRNRPVAALRDAGKLTDTDLWTPLPADVGRIEIGPARRRTLGPGDDFPVSPEHRLHAMSARSRRTPIHWRPP